MPRRLGVRLAASISRPRTAAEFDRRYPKRGFWGSIGHALGRGAGAAGRALTGR